MNLKNLLLLFSAVISLQNIPLFSIQAPDQKQKNEKKIIPNELIDFKNARIEDLHEIIETLKKHPYLFGVSGVAGVGLLAWVLYLLKANSNLKDDKIVLEREKTDLVGKNTKLVNDINSIKNALSLDANATISDIIATISDIITTIDYSVFRQNNDLGSIKSLLALDENASQDDIQNKIRCLKGQEISTLFLCACLQVQLDCNKELQEKLTSIGQLVEGDKNNDGDEIENGEVNKSDLILQEIETLIQYKNSLEQVKEKFQNNSQVSIDNQVIIKLVNYLARMSEEFINEMILGKDELQQELLSISDEKTKINNEIQELTLSLNHLKIEFDEKTKENENLSYKLGSNKGKEQELEKVLQQLGEKQAEAERLDERIQSYREQIQKYNDFISRNKNIFGAAKALQENGQFDNEQFNNENEILTSQAIASGQGKNILYLEDTDLYRLNQEIKDQFIQIHYLIILNNDDQIQDSEYVLQPAIEGVIEKILQDETNIDDQYKGELYVKVIRSIDELQRFPDGLRLGLVVGATVIATGELVTNIADLLNFMKENNIQITRFMGCAGDPKNILTYQQDIKKVGHFYSMGDTALTTNRKNKKSSSINFLLQLASSQSYKAKMLNEVGVINIFFRYLPYCYEKFDNATGYYTEQAIIFSEFEAIRNFKDETVIYKDVNASDESISYELFTLRQKSRYANEQYQGINEVNRTEQLKDGMQQLGNYTYNAITSDTIFAIGGAITNYASLWVAKKE